jgi:serine/threonine-protein kinase
VRKVSPLGLRIFGFSAIAIAVALGSALVVTRRVASRAAATSIDRALAATQSAIDDKLSARSQQLRAVAEGLVAVPSYLALVENALKTGDRSSLLDAGQSFKEQLGAEWVLITDANGILQAWSDHPDRSGSDLSGGALIGYALQGASSEGIWLEPSDAGPRLYQAVGVPFRAGSGSPFGVLVAALPVDSALALVIKRNTSSEIVVFSRDRANQPTSLVTTLPERVDLGPSLGTDTAVTRFLLAGKGGDWLGTVAGLRTAGGDPIGGVVGLRSHRAELAPYQRLERWVTLGLVAGLVVALLSSAWVARRITRPVGLLVAATRRVEAGDFTGRVDVSSKDEIGELARAFQHMVAELTEKQKLVEFLTRGRSLTGTTVGGDEPAAGPVAGQAALEPGTVVAGRYELKEMLGAGGMGVVYRAYDRELGETVALKTLHPALQIGSTTMLERFKQEIRLARRITHRNVVRTHDIGEVAGTYYITMEYVEGTTLDTLIARRGRLPVAVTLTVAKQLCRALEVAHEAGVIHRDIKPANLVVDGAGFLKVMDFGIARLSDDLGKDKPALTQAGSVIGSPDYMPPEQLMGDPLDHRVDIYAAGCVLFECLTGRRLYAAPNVLALISKQLEEPVPDVRAVNPEVPPALAAIITRAVAKDKNDRWPSASAMLEALEAVS